MPKVNRSVVRVAAYSSGSVGIRERHNERKNADLSYSKFTIVAINTYGNIGAFVTPMFGKVTAKPAKNGTSEATPREMHSLVVSLPYPF